MTEPSAADSDLATVAPATLVVAAGRPPRSPGAPVNVPIELSSTYAALPEPSAGYGRGQNATWSAFESTLGALEGGDTLVFASGMAAISAALHLAPEGRAILAPSTPYNTTGACLDELAAAGRRVIRVPIDDTAAVLEALAGTAELADRGGRLDPSDSVDMVGLLWLESPTNPLMEVADLPVLIDAARELGAIVVCDNTFATPLLQQPLALGADVVVHSVTKYLAGHSDVLLGATVTRGDEAGRALHERLLTHRTRHGAIAGPFEVFLALRGIRTLHVRFERACANAAVLARRLATHPAVTRVRYPGSGAMLAIEIVGDGAAAERVAASCGVWLGATSLGGVESLIERRRRYPGESELVPEALLRLSVGIEDVDDLWQDLDRALGVGFRTGH